MDKKRFIEDAHEAASWALKRAQEMPTLSSDDLVRIAQGWEWLATSVAEHG